jgi:DNA-directed RNA polymerase II subunit RPB7
MAMMAEPANILELDCAVSNIKPQGVFCDAGPLTVFVSKMHLPPDMKYNPDATPAQFSNTSGESIEKGSAVRVQIIGLRSDVGNMYAIGKMSANWFG